MKICLKWNAYELCGKTGSEIPCIELIWKVYRNVSWNAMHELIYDAYVWIGAVDAWCEKLLDTQIKPSFWQL